MSKTAKTSRFMARKAEKQRRKDRTQVSAPLGDLPALNRSNASTRLFDPEYTKEKGKKIITIIRNGAYADMGAAIVGITPRVLEAWLREGAQLIDLCPDGDISHLGDREKGLCQFVMQMQEAIATFQVENIDQIKRARGTWWQAAAWLLERRHPANWGRREKVTHEHERPTSQIDAKIIIASPDGTKAIGEVLRALAADQQPLRRGSGEIEPRRLGPVREQPNVEILPSSTPPESVPVGSGSEENQTLDRLDSA